MRIFVVDVRSEVHRDRTRALYARESNKDRSVDFVSRVWTRLRNGEFGGGEEEKEEEGAHKKKFNLSRVWNNENHHQISWNLVWKQKTMLSTSCKRVDKIDKIDNVNYVNWNA